MPENPSGIIRNERERFGVVSSQCGYQLRDDGTVVCEGLPVDVEYSSIVAGALGPKVHVRRR